MPEASFCPLECPDSAPPPRRTATQTGHLTVRLQTLLDSWVWLGATEGASCRLLGREDRGRRSRFSQSSSDSLFSSSLSLLSRALTSLSQGRLSSFHLLVIACPNALRGGLRGFRFEPELRSRARPHVSVLAVFGMAAPDKLDSATPSQP